MSFISTRPTFWPFKSSIARDADALIAQWGQAAYEKASLMSWHEDIGLSRMAKPGHWWRVQREIGRRFGRQEIEREAQFPADRIRPVSSEQAVLG